MSNCFRGIIEDGDTTYNIEPIAEKQVMTEVLSQPTKIDHGAKSQDASGGFSK